MTEQEFYDHLMDAALDLGLSPAQVVADFKQAASEQHKDLHAQVQCVIDRASIVNNPTNPYRVLDYCFVWSQSKQGHQFWRAIGEQLNDNYYLYINYEGS